MSLTTTCKMQSYLRCVLKPAAPALLGPYVHSLDAALDQACDRVARSTIAQLVHEKTPIDALNASRAVNRRSTEQLIYLVDIAYAESALYRRTETYHELTFVTILFRANSFFFRSSLLDSSTSSCAIASLSALSIFSF